MLINVNWTIIKNNQIKKSYCLMKINVNPYHHTSSRHLKKSHEGLYGLHKTLFRHHKEMRKQRFMPLVRLKIEKRVWWGPSVLKRNKLKIKIVEYKESMNESYLYLFVPHLFLPLLILHFIIGCVLWTCQQISLQISKML